RGVSGPEARDLESAVREILQQAGATRAEIEAATRPLRDFAQAGEPVTAVGLSSGLMQPAQLLLEKMGAQAGVAPENLATRALPVSALEPILSKLDGGLADRLRRTVDAQAIESA